MGFTRRFFFVRVLSIILTLVLLLGLWSCKTQPKPRLSDFSGSYSKREMDRGTKMDLYHLSAESSRLRLSIDPNYLPEFSNYEFHGRLFFKSGRKDSLFRKGVIDVAGELKFDFPLPDESVGWMEAKILSPLGEFAEVEVEVLMDKRARSRQNFSLVDAELDREIFDPFLLSEEKLHLFYRSEKVPFELFYLDDAGQRLPPPPFSKSRQKYCSELPRESVKEFCESHESYVMVAPVDSQEVDLYFSLQDPFFPAVDSPIDLLGPLRYICNKSEFEQLQQEPELKEAIDAFWIERSGSFERGRVLVSEFYGRVERANRLFSTAWAGWKTDPGMIYVIYGQADRVLKNERYEEWIYLGFNGKRDIRFLFFRKGDGSLELKRDPDFRKSWNENVYLWRSGIINNVSK